MQPKSVEGLGDQPQLQEEFVRIREELVDVHKQLADLVAAAASDPWQEARVEDELADLRQRRDLLLDLWARVGLSWLLRGGKVELIVTGATIAPPAKREPTPPPRQVATIPRPTRTTPPAEVPRIRDEEVGQSWSRPEQARPREADPEDLAEILKPLSKAPQEFADPDAVRDELLLLSDAIAPDLTERWLEFPREVQRALIGHIVARARHIQDELDEGMFAADLLPTLDRIFSSMTGFSKREQPGFVFGLMRSHTPVRDSWQEDAGVWWRELEGHLPEGSTLNPERALADLGKKIDADSDDDTIVAAATNALEAGVAPEDSRLVQLMEPHMDLLRKHARFKRVRKAIREAQADDEAFENEMQSSSAELPVDWSHWHVVRGKKAVIVGGDLRDEARERIEETFEFSSVEWVGTEKARNLQALADALESGSHDLVIVLRRFIGHEVDRTVLPACRSAGVRWVSVERGYGVSQIRLAIERFLAGA